MSDKALKDTKATVASEDPHPQLHKAAYVLPKPPFTPPSQECVAFDMKDTMHYNLSTQKFNHDAIKRLDAVADRTLPRATQMAMKSVRDNLVTGNLDGLGTAMEDLELRSSPKMPMQRLVSEIDREFKAVNANTGMAMQQDGTITIFERNNDSQSLRFGADGKWAVTFTYDHNGRTEIGTKDLAPEYAATELRHRSAYPPPPPTESELQPVVRDQLDSTRYIMRHSMFAPKNCNLNMASEFEVWLMMHNLTPGAYYASQNGKK